MPQLITKLSERRAMKKAKRDLDRALNIISGISPERVAEIEAEIAEAGITPQEYAEGLILAMIVDEVKTFTRKMNVDYGCDFPEEAIEEIDAGNIEAILEELVEKDLVIDNEPVHNFHRRKLDELRASVNKVRTHEPTSLSYEAIRSDFVTASKLMDCGLLDKATEARVAHIRIWGRALTEHEERLGRVPTQEEADEQFNIARVAVMVGGYDEHGMTIEEIAEAVDTTVEDVNACFAFLTDKGYRSAKH